MPETGATPLITATRNNHVGIVRELLSYNQTDVNKSNNDGETPLLVASKNGNGELVKILLNADEGKLSLNQALPETGTTPLLEALDNNHTDVAIELLSYNETNFKKPNKDGETPLFVASTNGQATIVLLLLRKEARMTLNTTEPRTGSTPQIAVIMNNQSYVNETDVNKTHTARETPVEVATFEGNTEISELLVDADAVMNKAATYGLTSLYWLQTILIYSLILTCN